MNDLWEKIRSPRGRSFLAIVLIFGILFFWRMIAVSPAPKERPITYSRFLDQLSAGNLESVSLRERRVTGKFRKEVELRIPGAEEPVPVSEFETHLPSFQGESLLTTLRGKDVRISVEPPEEQSLLVQALLFLLPWALIIGVWVYLMRRATQGAGRGGPGGIFRFGQSRARLYDVRRPPVTFDDVAGQRSPRGCCSWAFFPRKYLVRRLTVLLGGRGAERVAFDDVSTGAQNDLKQATALAEKMVAQWGMSDRVGPLSLGRGEEHPFLGRELGQPKRYSEEMAWLMDQEIRSIVVDAETAAEELLKGNRGTLDRLAEALLEEESLEKDDLERIIGRREETA